MLGIAFIWTLNLGHPFSLKIFFVGKDDVPELNLPSQFIIKGMTPGKFLCSTIDLPSTLLIRPTFVRKCPSPGFACSHFVWLHLWEIPSVFRCLVGRRWRSPRGRRREARGLNCIRIFFFFLFFLATLGLD